jgi:hypothetical protein
MNKQTHEMLTRLQALGISSDDAFALRRISMTLHRWFEMECGTENAAGASISIERDGEGGAGKPYQRIQYATKGGWVDRRYPIADRETGARKRLAAIVARYPGLSAYVQTDPRGAAVYILRPGDVPEGADVNAYYSRGVAVYR